MSAKFDIDPETGAVRVLEAPYRKVNFVISVKAIGGFPLDETHRRLGYGLYTPKRYSALTLKHANPPVTMIMFSTGNITLMGYHSEWASRYVLSKIMRQLGLTIVDIKINNVVTSYNVRALRRMVGAKDVYNANKGVSACEMNVFPCCSMMVGRRNVKANIFNTGAIQVMGARDDDDIQVAIRFATERMVRLANGKATVASLEREFPAEKEKSSRKRKRN